MLKRRLIPVLFLKNGLIVRSEEFSDFREFGNPINQLERLSEWNADELIYVDITRSGDYDLKRDDHKINRRSNITEILRDIAKACFMPLTFGGRIRTLEQVDDFMANGADKVIINTGAYLDKNLIKQVANKYGTQAVVGGIDVKAESGKYNLYIENGSTLVPDDPLDYARRAQESGAGEIFLNFINRDGMATGYDCEYIQKIVDAVSIPVIACGGAGTFNHFVEVMEKTTVAAVAAGNIFNFTEQAYVRAKTQLRSANINVR
ncbi:MAG: imidazole glycerol phosphate synthase cyclase subunit [bacterium]|nr:imidazole glycerol phosphate synthase cyclase subunit [bacterium]